LWENFFNEFVQFTDQKSYEEAAKRLKLEAMDREDMVPSLRKESRRQYLAKRKEDKVQELEADIMDDEYLFEDQVYVLVIYLWNRVVYKMEYHKFHIFVEK
jgi:hypothetical protein